MQGFTTIDLAILIIYLAAVLFAGLHFAKREMKGKEYFKGDGTIPWWVTSVFFFAALLSPISFLGSSLLMCLDYADTYDLLSLETGRYDIDGNRLFVNIVSCTTTRPEDFLVCYPSDGHRTAVVPEAPETIKKAIFKIRIH